MGKRKGRKETLETPISTRENGEIGEEAEERKGERFFACYLLTSLCPRFKGHTYIGFTVNPRRRIRQHNGEIGSGAWRTKRKRPWEMVLCIYGFPTNVAALQFEWAWQHPVKSLAVRAAAASFKSVSGLANKIKLAYTMLTLPAWQSLNLTMNFFSTKYQMYISGCPTLPEHMWTQVCSVDELPCYHGNEWEGEEECDANGSFKASTSEESTDHCSSEENVGIQMNQRENSRCGLSQCLDETWKVRPRNSPAGIEDHGQSCVLINDSPVSVSSSFLTNSHGIVSFVEDDQIKSDRPLQKQAATVLVTGEEPFSIKNAGILSTVEVIDIFTPSPCCTGNSGSKKRRPTMYPEIIDLTNSPMFV